MDRSSSHGAEACNLTGRSPSAGKPRLPVSRSGGICVELSCLLQAIPIFDDDAPALGVLMRPFPLSSCSVRLTCAVDRPVASPSSAGGDEAESLMTGL